MNPYLLQMIHLAEAELKDLGRLWDGTVIKFVDGNEVRKIDSS